MAVTPRIEMAHGGDVFAMARAKGWDWRDVVDFSANINPLGPSPRVREAVCRSVDRIAHYPDREPVRLQAALAAAWNLAPEQILCGNGATELISFVARICQEPKVTLAVPVFSEFHRLFPNAESVDLLNPDRWPLNGLLVLTRPANPTGWTLPVEILAEYLSRSAALVLVDESFIDFAAAPSAAHLLERYPRLLILRSLTKFYALPGLRLGALIGDQQLIGRWRNEREPWQVNVIAEEAGIAALQDEEHARASLQTVAQERAWLLNNIHLLPLADPQQSSANYLLVRLGFRAAALAKHLLDRKILIRNCAGWPGVSGEAIRITVRTRKENERLIEAWKEFPCA